MTTGPGYPSAPVAVVANVVAQILPPPGASQAGPVPPDLRWVVLVNSSPFTLLVQHGTVQGELAAFTSDLFQVDQGLDAVPITLLPQPPTISGGTLGTQDSTVYATWYESAPGGTYPSAIGAGTIQAIANASLVPAQGLTGPGTNTFPLVGTFNMIGFQAVSLFFKDTTGGAITSWTVALQWVDPANTFVVASDYFTFSQAGTVSVIRPAYSQNLIVQVIGASGGAMAAQIAVQGLLTFGGSKFALGTGVPLIDSGLVNVGAGGTGTLGTSFQLYGGEVTTYINGGAVPWLLRFDSFNEVTGGFDNKADLHSNDVLNTANGALDWWVNHIVDGSRPFRLRLTNQSGGAANFQAYTVPAMSP